MKGDFSIDVYAGSLIGLQSFYCPDMTSHATVTVIQDAELLYVDSNQVFSTGDEIQQRNLTRMITLELHK